MLAQREAGQIVRQVPLGDELHIGRATDNDLVLAGTAAARHHARVYRQDEHYFVANVSNGHSTWVNGIALIGQRRLRPGDRILIGDTELIYQPENGAALPATGSPPGRSFKIPVGPTERGPQAEKATNRRLSVALTPAGIVLVVALALVALYWLAPGVFQGAEPTSQPTATPAASATSLPPTPVPTQPPPTGTASLQISAAETAGDELARAEALATRSKFDEAIQIYQEVAREAPDDPRPEIGWAWALILDGFPDQALLHARRAGELAPTEADAAVVLARAYVEMGDAERALSWARRAVALDENQAEAYAMLALAHSLERDELAAMNSAELAVDKDASSAEAHRVQGWLYQEITGDTEAAIRELRIAAELEPELWLRHHELGTLLLEAGAYDEAIASLTQAMVLRHKAVTYTALGTAHFRLGQDAQAKSFLEQSLSAGAWDADSYGLLAIINARQGRCEDAHIYLGQALAQDPAHPQALEARVACPGAVAAGPTVPVVSSPEPTAPPPVLSGRLAFPVWNRDGGHYDVYVAAPDGSDRQLVAEQVHQPAFDPDGEWLALNGERPEQMNLLVVRPDGSGLKEVTTYIEDSLASWSPDGRSLVFGSTRHADRRSRIYVLDEVPFVGNAVQGRLVQSNLYELMGERPAWLPDGRIVYNSCDHTATPPQCGLFLVSSEPGPQEPVPLTDHPSDTAPAVHDDHIIFMSNRDENWEIYAVQVDGSGLARLTRNTANDGLPVWSLDGQTVAFVSDQGGIWAIWAMNPDGSNRRKLFDIGGGGLAFDWDRESISWSPR